MFSLYPEKASKFCNQLVLILFIFAIAAWQFCNCLTKLWISKRAVNSFAACVVAVYL